MAASYFSSKSTTSYDVFLSFRGADTRQNFTVRLYNALKQRGIYTFIDDNGIERGEDIKSELEKAIHHSRMSIIVLSKNYANSGWCLDELALILKRHKTSGHVIFPVFYHVEKSLFVEQVGSVAREFSRHEERFKEEKSDQKRREGYERMKVWKDTLREVAELGGMTLNSQADPEHELEFIQKLVKVTEDKLNRTAMRGISQLIAMEYRTKDINLWLNDEKTDSGVQVISGRGGIGKTTIAKFIYNLNSNLFESSSFLTNVRDIAKDSEGVLRLQKQLLCDILRREHVNLSSADDGIHNIKNALHNKKVLLVLDDVDQPDQLEAILGMRDDFCLGSSSKIIVTTREEWMLKHSEAYKIYKVENLSYHESLELFCWHAFGQDSPFQEYLELSIRVVLLCEGLPLALQVLGSSLSGKMLDVWESALDKLEIIPNNQIVKKLELSYDYLQDEHDKSLFLHISCFFVGMDRDVTTIILDDCNYFTAVGIQNLVDRNLLEIDDCKKLVMHHVIRDMGRGIVRQESPKYPGKRSRLWHYKDVSNVLVEKTGTETVEGIILDLHISPKRELDAWTVTCMDSSSSHGSYIGTDSFAKMQNLKLLKLNNVRVKGVYKDFPRRLRWLSWRHCTLKSIPNDFPLESLAVIDMRYSSLKQIWKGLKFLGSLKILNLSHSWELMTTPDFSRLHNIEKLILKDCLKLVLVHDSLCQLKKIVLLNLKDCRNLRTLPRNIGALMSLKMLDISGCSSLQFVPVELRMLSSLKTLYADGLAFHQLRATTNVVQPWNAFLSCMLKPRSEFSWSFLPCALVKLSLVNCNLSEDAFATDFRSLSVLENLDISENPIQSMPESFRSLSKLRSFNVQNCARLKSLTGLPNVKKLFIDHCTSLETISYQSALSYIPSVGHTSNNDNLSMLQGVFKLERAENIDQRCLKYFDLNLDPMIDTEVILQQFTSSKKRKLPLQALYEQGIFSIFLPGNRIPSFFFKSTRSTSTTFTISSDLKIRGLSIATFYSKTKNYTRGDRKIFGRNYWTANHIRIDNRTKDLTWMHRPTVFGVPEDSGEGMTWLSHWNFGTSLESGDELTVGVHLKLHRYIVEEFGLYLVYGEEDHDDGSSSSEEFSHPFFARNVVPGDVSDRGRLFQLPTWW